MSGKSNLGQRGWEEGQVQRQSWQWGLLGHSPRGSSWWSALGLGRGDGRWWRCRASRRWTKKGLICWAKFGFYPVVDKGKPLKHFKYRVIRVKCVFPGWRPAGGNGCWWGNLEAYERGCVGRQPGFCWPCFLQCLCPPSGPSRVLQFLTPDM